MHIDECQVPVIQRALNGMEGYGKEIEVGARFSLYGFRLAGLSSAPIGWPPALRLAIILLLYTLS